MTPTTYRHSTPFPCLPFSSLKNPKPPSSLHLTSTRLKPLSLFPTPKSHNQLISRHEANFLVVADRSPSPPDVAAASDRISFMVSEFRSLREPVERVKRLLHYAAILPPFEESARMESNRVRGCTTQVWLEVGVDRRGRMRFRADSDSEITKGFCSCLIWMLDEAEPEEVMGLRGEDLRDMNVGLVAHSRVNTWHNVLVSMQRRTEELVVLVEEEEKSMPADGSYS